MNKILNNEKNISDVSELDRLCVALDHQHAMERKIKFLLDIRGYLKVNNLKGSYFEFGSFRSHMQYCAFRVLENTNLIENYVGFDTFCGEPSMTAEETGLIPYVSEGSYSSNYEQTLKFVNDNIGVKGHLIKGDFRENEVLQTSQKFAPISVSAIDCNLASSIEKSLSYSFKNVINGGIIFIDDYYTNFGQGTPIIQNITEKLLIENNKALIELGYYAPFARSFIIVNKDNKINKD